MNQSDIKELLSILKKASKLQDWDGIDEAIEYLSDFLDEYSNDDE